MTTDVELYFGPFNDPGTAGTYHWNCPHAQDFENVAFTIAKVGKKVTIGLAARNHGGSVASPVDIKLYAMVYGASATNNPAGIAETLIAIPDSSIQIAWPGNGKITNLSQWQLYWPSQTVRCLSPIDDPWTMPNGPVTWTVPTAYGNYFVLLATLQYYAGNQVPTLPDPTQDPCVGVWLDSV